MRRSSQRFRSIAAAATLLFLLVGVPALLIATVGWPLPRVVPSLDRLRLAVQQGDVPGDVIVKAIAVVVWLIWLQLVWAIVWELVVNLRRIDRSERPVPAPVVPKSLSFGIGRLVAVALSVTTATMATANVAIALPGTPNSVFAQPPEPVAQTAQPADDLTEAAGVCWTVHPGDTLWGIAAQALGDGARVGEVIDLNPSITSARDIRAGQVLRLPADGIVPMSRQSPAAAADGNGAAPSTYLAAERVEIVRGDTLWDLSEDRLSAVSTEPVPAGAIVEYLDEVIATNAAVVEDPNLIYPGEVFELPAIGNPPPAPPPALTPPSAPIHQNGSEAPVDDQSGTLEVDDVDMLPAPPGRVQESNGVVPDATRPPERQSNEAGDKLTVRVDDGRSSASEQSSTTNPAPWLAGVSGATVLSSALLVAYRQRRRRQAMRSASAHRRSAHDSAVVESLVAAADVQLVTWAAHELASLFARIRPADIVGVPLAMELSESEGIELLWSHINASAPLPWVAADGGWSWRLTYDPDRSIAMESPAHPLPAMVTIGARNGRQLLLNLEAFGSVAVTGDSAAAEALVRSIAVELAANDLGADSYIHLVGFGNDTDAHFDRVSSRSEADAMEHLHAMVDAHQALLDDSGLESSFELRLSGDAQGRETTVIIVDSTQVDDSQALVEAAPADLGVAVVSLGESVGAGATITVDAAGDATIDQLDLTFAAAQLPNETVERVSDLLDETLEPVTASRSNDSPDEDESFDEADKADASDAHAPDDDLGVPDGDTDDAGQPEVLVRVLGVPAVDGFERLGRIETNIVTYLASHGGSATKDQLVNAVWGGRLVSDQTLFNRIAKTRCCSRSVPARANQGLDNGSPRPGRRNGPGRPAGLAGPIGDAVRRRGDQEPERSTRPDSWRAVRWRRFRVGTRAAVRRRRLRDDRGSHASSRSARSGTR